MCTIDQAVEDTLATGAAAAAAKIETGRWRQIAVKAKNAVQCQLGWQQV